MDNDNNFPVEEQKMHQSGHFMIKILTATTGFMAILILSAIMWGGSTLNNMQVTVGVLGSQLKQYNDQIMFIREEIKESNRGRYTTEQAANDRRLLEMEIKMINGRMNSMNERIETIKATNK